MKKTFCDRCGGEVEPTLFRPRHSLSRNYYNTYSQPTSSGIDLCCDCQESLDEWVGLVVVG